jgi:transposase InsO family protein
LKIAVPEPLDDPNTAPTPCESATLGCKLVGELVAKYGIPPGQLIRHSDRGAPMKEKSMVLLQADLGIRQSFNRPHDSNDNPFSDALFKTAKYALNSRVDSDLSKMLGPGDRPLLVDTTTSTITVT